MVVEYVADTTGLAKGVADVGMLVAGAAVAATVASVKMAGDFQKGLVALETGAGETASNLQMVGDGMKKIAVDTGTSTKDIESAMFMIESSGQHGAAGLNEMTIAAQGAKTDNADLTATTMALTGVMHDFHLPASDAAGAMNEIIASAKEGKMHMEDLASSLGAVLPVAENAGLKFSDVGAAIAMMTNAQTPALQASQNLAFAIRSLDAPSGVAVKSLTAVGLKAQDVADTLRNQGLPAALQLIEDHVGQKFPASSVEWTTAMKNIMGGKAGLNVALNLGGKNLQDYEKDVNNVTGALKAGGTSVEGWSTVQGTFNNQMDRAKASVSVLAIDIGTALLPVLGQILGAVTPAITAFGNWISSGHALSDVMKALHPVIAFLGPIFVNLGQSVVNLNNAVKPFLPVAILLGQVLGVSIVFAIGALVTVLTFLINSIANVTSFFEHNKVAADALKAVFLAIAVFSLPALLIALGTLAVDLAATGIASVIASAQMAGGFVASLITTAMEGWAAVASIGAFIGSMIASGVQSLISGAQIVGSFIAGLISAGIEAATTAAIIVGTFVTALITAGIEAVTAGIAFLIGLVPPLLAVAAATIAATWPFLLIALVVAAVVIGIILAIQHWGEISKWLTGVWNNVATWFKGFWAGIVALFGNIGGWFHDRWTEAYDGTIKAFGNIGKWFSDTWETIKTDALNAGGAIIKKLADGITGAIHWVTDAIHNVTQWISDHLPHSPAKVGPLMGLENQGMEISNQIAQGMVNGVPLITSAMNNLAKPVTVGLKGVASASSTPLQGGNQGDTYIQITLDGKDITNSTMKRVQRELRGHGLKK